MEPKDFHACVKKLRQFFEQKNWVEVHTQSRLSILAACEDPTTISTYSYAGQTWPLPQTGQMWLEHELLRNPDVPGFFCVSTSYRNEANPVPGRHDRIFPMFEFECKGGMETLVQLEKELLEYLGFGNNFPEVDYQTVAKSFQTTELEHCHEQYLCDTHGPVVFLENFPIHTSPFWNMKKETDTSAKVDVILHGIETIGSAERSTDPDEMREQFYSISNGNYANILFSNFTKERVEKELSEFLKFDFFTRCGGGIGVSRLIRAMKMSNLL
ncbi:MAG: transposase [Rhodospirillaceae bacterium]|nr:transposase [Rhodospirillaceae bacterium]